jgi:hypothetical protein
MLAKYTGACKLNFCNLFAAPVHNLILRPTPIPPGGFFDFQVEKIGENKALSRVNTV